MDNSKTTHTQILTIWIELIRMSTSGRHLPKGKEREDGGVAFPFRIKQLQVIVIRDNQQLIKHTRIGRVIKHEVSVFS